MMKVLFSRSDGTLRELADEASRCTRCKLSKSRTNVVFGEGDPHSHILFVGEAPGNNEDKKGIPFCGKSGEILDALLSSINLSREKIYITSILKCRPPNNRDPLSDEISACGVYLNQQIDFINPKVICCLGRFSLHFILQMYCLSDNINISQVHGRVIHKGDPFQTVPKIVALYHPAVALYNALMLPILQKDFEILATLIKT